MALQEAVAQRRRSRGLGTYRGLGVLAWRRMPAGVAGCQRKGRTDCGAAPELCDTSGRASRHRDRPRGPCSHDKAARYAPDMLLLGQVEAELLERTVRLLGARKAASTTGAVKR